MNNTKDTFQQFVAEGRLAIAGGTDVSFRM